MEKKYNFEDQQSTLKAQWIQDNIYQFSQKESGSVYSIDTPPPTVSGALHIGHIFSYTHTDFIARYQRMSNARVFYPFGFDDNGLPTEKYIEKNCKVSASKKVNLLSTSFKNCGKPWVFLLTGTSSMKPFQT